MSKSVKHLVMLALFTTMALTIFVVEAQIPVPVPIPGVKLGLANVITLIVLVVYRPRDAFAVLVLRILLGSIFTGTPVSLLYSLTGGILCFLGMALLCKLLQKKHLWFISIVGAVLHNLAAPEPDRADAACGDKALIGRVARAAEEIFGADDVVGLRIVDDDVGVAACSDDALAGVETVELGGIFAQRAADAAEL